MSDEHDSWLEGLGVSWFKSDDDASPSATEAQADSGTDQTSSQAVDLSQTSGKDAGQTDQATKTGARFELSVGGIGVMPDPADNPDNHVNPHHDAGTRISFEVTNVGDSGGNARVGVELDDTFITEWQSPFLDPGKSAVGFVSLGRLSQGQHTVLIYVNPGSSKADHQTNTFNVE